MHHFFKPEKIFSPRSGVFGVLIIMLIVATVMFIAKFDDVKAAFVHIKIDISFFKIRRYGFPYERFVMFLFNRVPSGRL